MNLKTSFVGVEGVTKQVGPKIIDRKLFGEIYNLLKSMKTWQKIEYNGRKRSPISLV